MHKYLTYADNKLLTFADNNNYLLDFVENFIKIKL